MKKLYHSVMISLTTYEEEDVLTMSGEGIYGTYGTDDTGRDIWG